MPEEVTVVVASEQVDVLAPPAEIRLSVGVGAAGKRGSRFYAGNQSPELFFAAMGETPNVYDLYLNTTSHQMVQLVATPTGTQWSVLFDLTTLIAADVAAAVASAVATAMSNMFAITDPVNNQTLKYSSATGKWINA